MFSTHVCFAPVSSSANSIKGDLAALRSNALAFCSSLYAKTKSCGTRVIIVRLGCWVTRMSSAVLYSQLPGTILDITVVAAFVVRGTARGRLCRAREAASVLCGPAIRITVEPRPCRCLSPFWLCRSSVRPQVWVWVWLLAEIQCAQVATTFPCLLACILAGAAWYGHHASSLPLLPRS